MNFNIPYELQILKDSIEKFICHNVIPLEDSFYTTGHLNIDNINRLKQQSYNLGFRGMEFPIDVGGGGLDVVSLCLVNMKIGCLSDLFIRRIFGSIPAILTCCNVYQQEKYLIPAIKGDIHISTAISEPGSGSDAGNIATHVSEKKDKYYLTGSKHFISDAEIADAFIVTASDVNGISCFIIDKNTKGLCVAKNQAMMGHYGVSHNEVFFDECQLNKASLLGERGKGLQLILKEKNKDRLIHIASRSIGLSKKILQKCIEFSLHRVQFGKSISEFQLTRKKLSEMQINLFAAEMMVLNCAWNHDQGNISREKISAVKIFASEMLCNICDEAIQIHGGMGYCSDLPFERYYRDARAGRIYEGTTEIHHLAIAKKLLKDGIFEV